MSKKRSIFEPRENFKPFEYKECEAFTDAINQAYWLHSEFNLTTDIQEYNAELDDYQKEIIKKCLLLISQIELSVKKFWLNLESHLPKPEILMVGSTFADSEARHSRAYSHLLEVMGFNEEFKKIYNIPVVIDRHNYLKKYKEFANARLEENFVKSIILFTLFIENVSLFSQFFVIQSFNKHRKLLRGISNIVSATSKEEAIHGEFGSYLINVIREENPEFFTDELKDLITNYCKKAYYAEEKIIDWVFNQGDTDFIKTDQVKEFIKDRLNQSLESIGLERVFEINSDEIKRTKWFEEELLSDMHQDFFDTRSIGYSKFNKSFGGDDLF